MLQVPESDTVCGVQSSQAFNQPTAQLTWIFWSAVTARIFWGLTVSTVILCSPTIHKDVNFGLFFVVLVITHISKNNKLLSKSRTGQKQTFRLLKLFGFRKLRQTVNLLPKSCKHPWQVTNQTPSPALTYCTTSKLVCTQFSCAMRYFYNLFGFTHFLLDFQIKFWGPLW